MNNNDSGFTLIELIVVILVLSVLALTSLPKISTATSYSAYTDRDQLISLLRSIQTRAMQNTQDGYCYAVAFTTNNIGMLEQNNTGGCTSDFLVSVGDTNDFLNIRPENIYTTTDSIVYFDDFGRPEDNSGNSTGRVIVTFDGRESVCIESEGYIHVCS